MQNILKTILGLGALAAVHAVPVSFLDVVSGGEYLSNSGTSNFTFTHNILDNGFVSATDDITSADLYILLNDDLDQASENVRIKLDNVTVAQSMEVDYALYHFIVNSVMLQTDGMLTVNLNVLSGDFYFGGSALQVDANRAPAVPEPTSMAMLGAGLVGLGLLARRRKA
jgi:hypothetical protein